MSRNGIAKSELNPSDDICPVCKSNRYLNPSLQFLINPECYHKMCSTCVDRIFSSGPASCPMPHCGKTLRKKGFHKAFFGDLKVEREVDIRKRVGSIFNRRQDEFETLRDWNDYLQDVEDLTFDLVQGTPKEKAQAEEKLKAYREGNKDDIEENRKAGMEQMELEKRKEQAERDAARRRRLAIAKQEEEEKLDLAKSREDVLERLANTNEDANEITKQASKVILKKSSARRNLLEAQTTSNGSSGGSVLSIRGLKRKQAAEPEKPYDPFGGIHLTPSRYVLQEHYENEWLGNAKHDVRHMAGGYSLQEYYARTMFEAFSGLGVFIEDEVAERPEIAAPSSVGTAAASQASMSRIKVERKKELDDVF